MRVLATDPVLRALSNPCWRKEKHQSQGKAEAALRSMRRQSEWLRDGDRLNVYQCVHCRQWHVGHRPGEP
jgi:hypothetical protein